MKGVTIGEKHSYRDFDLYLGKETSISFPEIKENIVNVPGADNELDFSESLTGDIKFETREIQLVFYTKKKNKNWRAFISEIANYLHGKKTKIIFDDDINFYYIGRRLKVNPLELDEKIGKITIDVKADAYKYDLASSDEDWEWDPFDFETGIINETKELKVIGDLEVIIIGRRQKVIPKFTCNNPLQLIFNNETYNLAKGISYSPDIEICEGENLLKFVGDGIVSISYRGGSL